MENKQIVAYFIKIEVKCVQTPPHDTMLNKKHIKMSWLSIPSLILKESLGAARNIKQEVDHAAVGHFQFKCFNQGLQIKMSLYG